MAGISTGTTPTIAQANEVCIGCIGFNVSTSTDSPTNSFSEITERFTGAPDLTVLERIVSSIGTYGTSVALNPTINNYSLCGAIATFKAADAGFTVGKSSTFLVFH